MVIEDSSIILGSTEIFLLQTAFRMQRGAGKFLDNAT